MSERIVIIGGPGTGKTTLAADLGLARGFKPRCTDEVMSLGWSEASAEVSKWLDVAGPWIIEGVAIARALRKWLQSHPEGKPCDMVRFLMVAYEPLTTGQWSMAKGIDTVWREIEGELKRRGVAIQYGPLN